MVISGAASNSIAMQGFGVISVFATSAFWLFAVKEYLSVVTRLSRLQVDVLTLSDSEWAHLRFRGPAFDFLYPGPGSYGGVTMYAAARTKK